MKNCKIVVSMTSYPGRIGNVETSISSILDNQTLPPDEVHLWLAREEFPKELDSLPRELVNGSLERERVILHWLEKNTYVHKRHEIFNLVNSNDHVFFIDDDVIYNEQLIETVMRDESRFPNTIINYNTYSEYLYSGRKIMWKIINDPEKPSTRNRWCGQSMIPAKLYPKYVLTDEMKLIRDTICPISDECWLTPFLVWEDVPVFCEHFGWGVDIDPVNNNKWMGLVKTASKRGENGLTRRENWLAAVLDRFPYIRQKYADLFYYEGN